MEPEADLNCQRSTPRRASSNSSRTRSAHPAGLEKCMIGGRSTNLDAVARMSGQPIDRVKFALAELGKRRLIGFAGENYVIYTTRSTSSP